MAQKILLRRGGLANIDSGATIAVSQGEQLFGSGSLSNTNIGDVTFVANADGNGTFVAVGRLFTGTAAADGFDSKLNGLPYYRTDENALYRLGESSALDLSGNLEGGIISSIQASGSFSGSFEGNGSGLTNLSLGSITAPGSDTQLLFNDGGTIGASSNLTIDGSVLEMNGTISGSDLQLSGNANIDGNVTIGGNITIGDQTTDFVNFGAEVTSNFVPDLDSTYDLGTLDKRWQNIYVDNISGSTIEVDGPIVSRGAIEASGNLVGADVQINEWNSVSASLAAIETSANALTLDDVTTQGNSTTNDISGSDILLTGDLTAVDVNINGWNSVSASLASVKAGADALTLADVTANGNTSTGDVIVNGDLDADDVTINQWGSVSASLASISDTAAGAGLQQVTDINAVTTNEITTAGATAGNVKVGVTSDNTLDTSTGNLTINSAGGTVTVDDNLTVTGDLVVTGTRTIVNSTEVDIDDNIIVLNAAGGVADGGINVVDAVSTAGTGSLLWNATSDYWYAGLSGSTHYRLATYANQTPTSDKVTRIDSNKRLVASSISDNGSAISSSVDFSMEGNNITNLGSLGITGLTANAFVYTNASKVISTVAPSEAGDLIQWNGSAFEASNVIDGGTF